MILSLAMVGHVVHKCTPTSWLRRTAKRHTHEHGTREDAEPTIVLQASTHERGMLSGRRSSRGTARSYEGDVIWEVGATRIRKILYICDDD